MTRLFFTVVLIPSFAVAVYEPFTVKDGIIAGYDAAAGAFTMAAKFKAVEAENFQHPTVLRYQSLAHDCQTGSKSWSKGSTLLLAPILKADLKDPKQVAVLGLVTSIATIAAVKLISAGIDYCVSRLSK